jgi:hypothetical protein
VKLTSTTYVAIRLPADSLKKKAGLPLRKTAKATGFLCPAAKIAVRASIEPQNLRSTKASEALERFIDKKSLPRHMKPVKILITCSLSVSTDKHYQQRWFCDKLPFSICWIKEPLQVLQRHSLFKLILTKDEEDVNV